MQTDVLALTLIVLIGLIIFELAIEMVSAYLAAILSTVSSEVCGRSKGFGHTKHPVVSERLPHPTELCSFYEGGPFRMSFGSSVEQNEF